MTASPGKVSCSETDKKDDSNPTTETVNDEAAFVGRMRALYNSPMYSDVVLRVGNMRYYAHKFLLITASEVFRAMLNEDKWKESREPEIELTEDEECVLGFGDFLRYIYSGNIEVTTDSVLPILLLADKYGIKDLQKSCVAYMLHHIVEYPDTNRTLTWYQYAKMTSQVELQENCLKFVLSNFDLILKTSDWLSLSKEEVIEFLKNSDLIVPCEFCLWKAVEEWVMQLPSDSNIKECLVDIVPLLRFTLIPPKQLLQIELSSLCKKHPELFAVPLNASYRYHSLSSDLTEIDIGKEPFRNFISSDYGICQKLVLKNFDEVHKIDSKIDVSCEIPIYFVATTRDFKPKQLFRIEFFPKGFFKPFSMYRRYLGRHTDMTTLLIECASTDVSFKAEFTVVFYGKKKELNYIVYTYNGKHTFCKENPKIQIDNVIPLKTLTEENSPYLVHGDLQGRLFIRVQEILQVEANS